MRAFLILNVLGFITIGFSILLLLPIIVAVIYGEWSAIMPFVVASIIGLAAGFAARLKRVDTTNIHRTEGMVIVAFSWIIAAILGAIPYMFFNLNVVDSIFESMSGITTTGATIFTDFSLYPKALFFWRSFTQWLGGLGILVLFIAILPQLAVAGRQLFFSEAPGPTEDRLTPRIRHTAINLWSLYIVLTVIEIVLLALFGMPVFDSVCNSLSTLAAGGFSPHPQSIWGYHNPAFEWIIITFMFLAGANFALQFRVITKKNPLLFFKNSEFLFYSLIVVTATILLSLVLFIYYGQDEEGYFRIALFQIISILTTTGFATTDFNLWPEAAQILLLALFFVGGCAGSSGGGIKVVRILLLFKSTFKEMLQVIHPKSIHALWLDKQVVSSEIMRQIVIFFNFYILILILSTIFVSVIESDIILGFTTAAATLGNIGPGLGLAGPMGSYAGLDLVSKLILTVNMWIGRLEIITVLVLFNPYLWKNLRK